VDEAIDGPDGDGGISKSHVCVELEPIASE